jgi:PAS domain S-box-containing protein
MKKLSSLGPKEGIAILVALIAAGTLFLAPFWAYRWFRQPFIGAFIEPNLVISRIGEEDWPARRAGVAWPDRLRMVNGVPVSNAADLMAILDQEGWDDTGRHPLRLSFDRREGLPYEVTIQPRHVQFGELFAQFIIPYLVGVAMLAAGVWVYRLGGERRAARAFLLFTSAVSVTTGAYLDVNTTHHFVIGWSLSVVIAAGALGYLSLVFPKPMPIVNKHPWVRLLPWFLVLPLALVDVREIYFPSSPWGYLQPWIMGYGIEAVAILFFLVTLVVRMASSSSPVTRQQSRIIIFGAALAFGPVLLFYMLPISFGVVPAFQSAFYFPPLLIFLFAVAYAILRYRMLDVDRFLSLAMTYLLTSLVALFIFFILITVLSLFVGERINASNPALVALYLFVLVILLNPLRTLAQRTIDRLFYRTNADYRRALTVLSRDLVLSPDITRTQRILEREITLALQPRHFALYLYDDDSYTYFPLTHYPVNGPSISPDSALIQLLNRLKQGIWFPPGQSYPQELDPDLETLKILDCEVFFPLRYEGRLIGFMGLGGRRSGVPYSSDDLEFLDAVAAQSTLALENARLFANLKRNLAETLEMKNLMDDIFASIASGVITTDLERKITLFNQASEHILGLPGARVLGMSLESVLPAFSPRLEAIADATIHQGTVTLDEEFSPSMPERGDLFLRLSCAPLRDAQAGTKGATIVIDDFTEQHHLEAERERIRQTFGRVVAPRVRDRLLSEPGSLRLDGIRQSVAVIFADIHGFTPLSERLQPEILFEVLNSYLSLAACAILDEEGTLDKFMGDAVMAIWNAPDEQSDYALRAVRAALAINQAVVAHRQSLPPDLQLQFSIGITCGEAMVGNVGTSELFNYTVIGDTVNLAQRLEAVAEPEQILISEAAYQRVAEHIIARQLPPIKVKGREKEEIVYELIGMKDGE